MAILRMSRLEASVRDQNNSWLVLDSTRQPAWHQDSLEVHSEGEGIRLVKKTAKWLVENGHVLLLPQLVMASGSKYAGYWLGKHYKKLPEGLIRSLTMNPAYWEGEVGDGR